MVIRAGVDDRQMTSALGINIQLTFAIAFFVGSALAAFGARRRRLAGIDRSGPGRAVAAVLARRRDHRRDGLARSAPPSGRSLRARVLVLRRVPADGRNDCCTQYSIVLTFALHRARARVPASGAVREGGMTRRSSRSTLDGARHRDRRARRRGRSRPLLFSDFWRELDPHPGAHPRHRRGEPHLPLGVRRDDLARPDRAHGDRGLRARRTWSRSAVQAARRRASLLGWNPTVALVAAPSSLTVGDRARLRRRCLPELRHLLPDAHADLRA